MGSQFGAVTEKCSQTSGAKAEHKASSVSIPSKVRSTGGFNCCNIPISLIDSASPVSGSKRVIAWLQHLPTCPIVLEGYYSSNLALNIGRERPEFRRRGTWTESLFSTRFYGFFLCCTDRVCRRRRAP